MEDKMARLQELVERIMKQTSIKDRERAETIARQWLS